jgi:two-component system sensor histidine kinase UhpB
LLEKSPEPAARELSSSIRDAALHIQDHVKEIMRQLRPVSDLDFGLEPAIADLVGFWSRRHPDIHFVRSVAVGPGPGRRREQVAYRIVQESLSNAVRHGEPKQIRITIADEKDELQVCVEDDGGGLRSDARANMSLGQIGLVGMEERVRTVNGQFRVEEVRGRGVRVSAVLPKALEQENA